MGHTPSTSLPEGEVESRSDRVRGYGLRRAGRALGRIPSTRTAGWPTSPVGRGESGSSSTARRPGALSRGAARRREDAPRPRRGSKPRPKPGCDGRSRGARTLRDMAALGLRDARAAIRDRDRHAVAAPARLDADPWRDAGSRRPAVLERVVEEVRHGLPEELAIAVRPAGQGRPRPRAARRPPRRPPRRARRRRARPRRHRNRRASRGRRRPRAARS